MILISLGHVQILVVDHVVDHGEIDVQSTWYPSVDGI